MVHNFGGNHIPCRRCYLTQFLTGNIHGLVDHYRNTFRSTLHDFTHLLIRGILGFLHQAVHGIFLGIHGIFVGLCRCLCQRPLCCLLTDSLRQILIFPFLFGQGIVERQLLRVILPGSGVDAVKGSLVAFRAFLDICKRCIIGV